VAEVRASNFQQEPGLIEIPWKHELAEGTGILQRLSITILWDDGVVVPYQPILNALKRTKDALIAAGHEVITWEPLDRILGPYCKLHATMRVLGFDHSLIPRQNFTSLTVERSIRRGSSTTLLCPKLTGFYLMFLTVAKRLQWQKFSSSCRLGRTFIHRSRLPLQHLMILLGGGVTCWYGHFLSIE
jgi:hypothetical protein